MRSYLNKKGRACKPLASLNARRFSMARCDESCEKPMRRVHCEQMHQSSFDKMTAFRRDHLEARREEALVIVDLGSQDINGSYRPLFALPPWQYLGVDLAGGNNVDIVLANPYDWRELSPASADVIVAGQTFEHTE